MTLITNDHPNIGRRIRLVQMGNDPDPIEPGAEGTITMWQDVYLGNVYAQVSVNWDSGRTLMLCIPDDNFEFLT